MELVNWILLLIPVQIAAGLFVMVTAGFAFTVTVYVNGVPPQLLLEGVMANGVMVYNITASMELERLITESIIFPVPLPEFPVTEPELIADIHEKVLPEIAELAVKFNFVFEQIVCVVFVPVLSG